MATTAEEMRLLHEDGELDWTGLHPAAALAWAFLDEDEEPPSAAA